MSRPTNSIGTHRFLSLDGAIDTPGETIDVVERKNVDGTGLFFTGKRGVPFTLTSTVDQADLASAGDTMIAYKDTLAEGLLTLIHVNANYDNVSVQFKVLEVVEVTRRTVIYTGWELLNPPHFAQLIAEWTLVAVAIP